MCIRDRGALAREIGGDRVQVCTATTALQDAHHVDARPSLIARARSADLLIATGADPVSYTHIRAHETVLDIVCRHLLEKKNTQQHNNIRTTQTNSSSQHTTHRHNLTVTTRDLYLVASPIT